MITPKYKGPGQPTPGDINCVTGWLGGYFGGTSTPPYKTTTTVPPAMAAVAPAPPGPPGKPSSEPTLAIAPVQSKCVDDAVPEPIALDEYVDAVIPVGPGPITIVISPRG